MVWHSKSIVPWHDDIQGTTFLLCCPMKETLVVGRSLASSILRNLDVLNKVNSFVFLNFVWNLPQSCQVSFCNIISDLL